MDRAALYNMIYGMELFKPRFQSAKAYQKASVNVIETYEEAQSKGLFVGPRDFNQIIFDMNSGEIVSFPTERIYPDNCSYDQWKYYPEEFYTGNEWGKHQDLYCLAVVLYALRYYSLPYDGIEECRSFSMEQAQRKENYRHLHFVFSDRDQTNRISPVIGANTVSRWDEDDNSAIKKLFCNVFADRTDSSCRPLISEWKSQFIAADEQNTAAYTLSKEGIAICLRDGLELSRKDISPAEDDRTLGIVVSSNKDRKVLALGNTSEDTWRVNLPNGQSLSVAPKSAAPITKGALIDFGFEKVRII